MSNNIKVFDEIPYIEGQSIILKKISEKDIPELTQMVSDKDVYRFLPTFLFEKRYSDIKYVIKQIYDECFEERESVFLGIYPKKEKKFCGIAEMYGFNDKIHKISIGYRLIKEYWGRGIASETVLLLTDYLYSHTDTEIITASTMAENHASARVLEKNGFSLVVSSADEDWGYDKMTKADKWIK